MNDLDVWDMVQRKERAILLSQRRAEQRRQVMDAIARMMRPAHPRPGWLRRVWHVATARAQRRPERGDTLSRGGGHGHVEQSVRAAAEQAHGVQFP